MNLKTNTSNLMAFWIAIVALGTHGGLWAKDGFDNIYIFGESLSDPGNVYALTGETAKAPYEPIPSAAYAIGGHQFSNGKTWAQRFGKAAYGSSGKYGNYAFAGTRLAGDSLALSATDQIMLFLGDQGGVADGEALYVIQFGGNDVRDALVAYLVGGPGAAGLGERRFPGGAAGGFGGNQTSRCRGGGNRVCCRGGNWTNPATLRQWST